MLALSDNPTTQEVYEHIRAYFSRPEAVLAKGDNGWCQYRTAEGNKCAVGCLIPDEMYFQVVDSDDSGLSEQRIEEHPVEEIVEWGQLHDLLNGDSDEGRRKLAFLTATQKAHDRHAMDAADFVRALDLIGRIYELEHSQPDVLLVALRFPSECKF